MANTIKANVRFANKIFYEFKQAGKFLSSVNFKNEDFKPSENVGGAFNYRRPSKSETFQTATDALGTTPTVGSAPTYGNYTEPTLQLVVARKFAQRFVISQQDMTLGLTEGQVLSRQVKQGVITMRRQIEAYAAGIAMAGAGQTVGTPGTPATGTTLLDNFAKAAALMNNRGLEDDGKRVALVTESQAVALQGAGRTLFNPTEEISRLFRTGSLGQYANLNFAHTPLLPGDKVTIASVGTPLVNGAGQSAGAVWTQTWSLVTDGWTANAVIPAGTLITLSNGATPINWVVPDTFVDTGTQAVFRVVSTVTASAGGAATLVLSEPLIGPLTGGGASTNGYQNVTALPADNATITVINNVASYSPALVFDTNAVLGVSPEIYVPASIKSRTERIDGISVTFIESADPFNYAPIWEVQAMVGFVDGLPEGVVMVS